MLKQKITLLDKLKHTNKQIDQLCKLHNLPSKYYCSKIECTQYSYLCDYCKRQNIHSHHDELSQHNIWIQIIINKINEISSLNRLMSTQYNNNSHHHYQNNFDSYIKQLKRILNIIQNIQNTLMETIRQSKFKIMAYIRKYQSYKQSRLIKFINLYTNPYLLINKINSQKNDIFIKQIKRVIKGENIDDVDNFNSKKQVIILQNKLKSIISGNSNQIFSKIKQNIKVPVLQILQNSVFYCDNKPQQVFMKNQMLMIGYGSQTQLFNANTLTMINRLRVTLIKSSCLNINQQNQVIGINKQNNKELITYINNKLGSFVFQYKIYSVLLYYKDKYYAFIGREEGKITIFDISNSKILANLQESHNMGVQFMQFWENQMKILTCGVNTAISIYKIQNLSNQVGLIFQEQFDFQIQNIQQFIVHSTFMIICSKNRNILAYDMILRQVYQVNLSSPCKQFDFLSVVSQNDNFLILLTHNKDENEINSWSIQKQNPQKVLQTKISFFGGAQIQLLQLQKKSIWVMKTNDSQYKIYNFNIVIM